jgi:hypothetical protein
MKSKLVRTVERQWQSTKVFVYGLSTSQLDDWNELPSEVLSFMLVTLKREYCSESPRM